MINTSADLAKFMLNLHKDVDEQMLETLHKLRDLEKDFDFLKSGNDRFEQDVNKFIETRTQYQNIVNENAFDKAQEIIKNKI